MLPIKFRDESHHKEFEELLHQIDLNQEQLINASKLLKRQVAFLYLISLYQKEYEVYEGCKFYLEEYEEVSIDGPVYLLEDQVALGKYPHEKMLLVAKNLLKQENLQRSQIEEELQIFIDEAISIMQ